MTWTILIAVGAAILVAVAGGMLTEIGPWYRGLRKPRFQPPNWAFGPAWTVIFALAAAAGVLGWEAAPTGAARAWVVALFVVNGGLNIGWSGLFFRLRRPDWALIEVGLLWLSILALILVLWPLSAGAAWCLAPYLAWVSFAALLNWRIVRLNRSFAEPTA